MADLILIGGGSCSGKTTLADGIKKALGRRAILISTDNFYKGFDPERKCCRSGFNFDHPDAVDFNFLFSVIEHLLEGKSVKIPDYDFASHLRLDTFIEAQPADFIILEGIFAIYTKKLVDISCLKIYVDCGVDVMIRRRIERDAACRARQAADVIGQFLDTVLPMYYEYVEPTKDFADIVVDGTKPADVILKEVFDYAGGTLAI
jgi:uridine kinase